MNVMLKLMNARILTKFWEEMGPGRNRLDSDGDPDFPVLFSISRQGINWYFAVYLSKLWTDFDENFWNGERGPATSRLDFSGDPGQLPDTKI